MAPGTRARKARPLIVGMMTSPEVLLN